MNTPVIHIWGRTKEEIVAPFEDENSTIYKAGLRLISCRMVVLPCPHLQELEQQIDPGINLSETIVTIPEHMQFICMDNLAIDQIFHVLGHIENKNVSHV